MPIKTQILDATSDGLAAAANILRAGGLVAFATETVYGLGGDARDDRAVARIFEAKARPTFNPLIVHVPDVQTAQSFAVFNAQALALAKLFWPGPLTMVLPLQADAGLSPLVTAGLGSVAIRVPAHPAARALLRAFDGPLAAPSANPSGRISPTRSDHVVAGLSGRIEAVLDAGPCAVGVESTIIGLVGTPALLRPGGVPQEALETALGMPLCFGGNSETPNAPGQLASHYAPNAGVRLGVTAPEAGEIWIGFGPDCGDAALSLSPTGDLVEAAAALFHTLRLADEQAVNGRIAFAPIPESGLGRAINDRLRRAAAPRDEA
jgi:L-threonylcarbamoyladenylate synthase